MTTKTTPAAETAAKAETKPNAVDVLIREAGEAGNTMYAKAREAAKVAASAELPALSLKPIAEQVAFIVGAHKAAFDAAGHNVKAIFSDALWLLAAPKAETVEIKVAGTPDNKPHQVKAAEALDGPKHQMRDAAKQVREAHGAARATGGGRKAEAKGAPANVAEASPVNTWYDTLAVKLADPGEFAKIVAVLERAGYVVTKKGKQVKAGKPATNADAPSMANQLKAAVVESKILAAAA